MEWTREKTLALIAEYRKRQGLWDMQHEDYRKKEIKQKLLLEVVNSLACNISTGEIEKKFHTLRTQFHREINRQKRKEPYNSKWFGFKYLQFLNSPSACRNKHRIKSEITEEGTVTTSKYIVKEADASGQQSGHDTSGEADEFLIHRKPEGSSQLATRSHRELEKLIEETTKDVDEPEEDKPKMTIKDIPTYEHLAYGSPAPVHGQAGAAGGGGGGGGGDEINVNGEHEIIHHPHHPHQAAQQTQPMDEDAGNMETLETTAGSDEPEITYHTATHHHGHHHQHPMSRIVKIQRREIAGHEEEYYEEQQPAAPQPQTQSSALPTLTPHHIHTLPATTKRIYYDANGHQHTTTILTATTSVAPQHQSGPTTAVLTPVVTRQQLQPAATSAAVATPQAHLGSQQSSPTSQQATQPAAPPLNQTRDEFSTYGEYVANELRGIANREILIALKHKINTALFEASMAELQK